MVMAGLQAVATVAVALVGLTFGSPVDGLAAQQQQHWAVLVAGSSGFWNYRHQADVCHAYHILMKRGLHPDRVITMIYDDAANAEENPLPGKLYNRPAKTMADAIDVYAGCQIDYKGSSVNPDQFIGVLLGDQDMAKGRKVLQSGPEDHVFVNFVDHGAVGLIAFPEDAGVLHARRLVSTLESMHQKGMYKQLTFYLETCESGSMFSGLLPESLPLYAVTAANGRESSYGAFCGDDAQVGETNLQTCLGDLFSVNWMADTEEHAPSLKETLGDQFASVRAQTNKSHVMRYGQVSAFSGELVSDFVAAGATGSRDVVRGVGGYSATPAANSSDSVSSRDAKLDYLYRKYSASRSDSDAHALTAEIEALQAAKQLGRDMLAAFTGQTGDARAVSARSAGKVEVPTEWTPALLACHEAASGAFGRTCGWSSRHLPLSADLYRMCVLAGSDQERVLGAVLEGCPPGQGELVV